MESLAKGPAIGDLEALARSEVSLEEPMSGLRNWHEPGPRHNLRDVNIRDREFFDLVCSRC